MRGGANKLSETKNYGSEDCAMFRLDRRFVLLYSPPEFCITPRPHLFALMTQWLAAFAPT